MMIMTSNQRTRLATIIRVLIVGEAIAFLLIAPTHIGLRISLGFATLTTLKIVDALIVESLCGIFFAASAYLLLTHRPQAWLVAIMAHIFALTGILVGMGAIAAGLGPHDTLNDDFHRVMLAVLIAGLILLITPAARNALNGVTIGEK